jgi:glycosyltransferase involved in cell wall biosynthesis
MNKLIVLAQVWPDQPFGGSIAMASSLRQYELGFDSVVYVGLTEKAVSQKTSQLYIKTNFVHIETDRGSLATRFLKSLLFSSPAITVGVGEDRIYERVKKVILSEQEYSGTLFGVCDDNVPAVHLPRLKADFPKILWAYRSHDVLHEAFSSFAFEGNWWMKLAWRYEIKRIKQFERNSVSSADYSWAISSEDKALLETKFGKSIQGVFDCDIDLEKYDSVDRGDTKSILYLGSADYRKKHGLTSFVENVWKEIASQERFSKCSLILGGKGTQNFKNSELSIDGLGFVDSDEDFLGKGMFFMNPQQAGTGLKLKSLVAMAARKVLITTPNGALGLGGTPGIHYVVAADATQMVLEISRLLDDPNGAIKIASAGRTLVEENFSYDAFGARIQPLLQDFISKKLG